MPLKLGRTAAFYLFLARTGFDTISAFVSSFSIASHYPCSAYCRRNHCTSSASNIATSRQLSLSIQNEGTQKKMNSYQQQLYNDLMTLCKTSGGAFIYKDEGVTREEIYRIFNYRLAGYSEFCKDNALECRGIMFLMQKSPGEEGQEEKDVPGKLEPSRLASLPMEKFFNLGENPFTIDLDLSKIIEAEVKQDGSLISTFINKSNKLGLKSKFSLQSSQVIAATKNLKEEANKNFCGQLKNIASSGYTVNLEWTAPKNQIVVPYSTSGLTVLNIRSHDTGKYIGMDELASQFHFETDEIVNRWTGKITHKTTAANSEEDYWPTWIEKAVKENGIEGYVLLFENGSRVKLKTEWYKGLHKAKCDTSARNIFEVIVDESIDDMRDIFNDLGLTEKVDRMESIVAKQYNSLVQLIEDFYNKNKDLDRKDYMIKGQKELEKEDFALSTKLYLGREVDYKKAMKKRWYGIRNLFIEDFYNKNKDLDRKDYMIKGQKELEKKDFAIAVGLYNGKSTDFYNKNKDLDRKDYMIKGQKELEKTDFAIAVGLYNGK